MLLFHFGQADVVVHIAAVGLALLLSMGKDGVCRTGQSAGLLVIPGVPTAHGTYIFRSDAGGVRAGCLELISDLQSLSRCQ